MGRGWEQRENGYADKDVDLTEISSRVNPERGAETQRSYGSYPLAKRPLLFAVSETETPEPGSEAAVRI